MEGRYGDHSERDLDLRVRVSSKRTVLYQLTKYKSLLKNLLDGQPRLSEDDKEKLSQEILTNFETAVQENVVVDGLSWEEAAEDIGEDCELRTLDDMLDEKIVQTTRKRAVYPKKTLPYVVRSLKAERKLMGLFANTVKTQEMKRDPAQDAIMNNVSAAAPKMFKEASSVVKSLNALNQVAEGLHQVLNFRLSAETAEIYREVFSSCPAPSNKMPTNRYTIKGAVSQAEYSMDYVLVSTDQAASASAENSTSTDVC